LVGIRERYLVPVKALPGLCEILGILVTQAPVSGAQTPDRNDHLTQKNSARQTFNHFKITINNEELLPFRCEIF
jgi:hypothetical protein